MTFCGRGSTLRSRPAGASGGRRGTTATLCRSLKSPPTSGPAAASHGPSPLTARTSPPKVPVRGNDVMSAATRGYPPASIIEAPFARPVYRKQGPNRPAVAPDLRTCALPNLPQPSRSHQCMHPACLPPGSRKLPLQRGDRQYEHQAEAPCAPSPKIRPHHQPNPAPPPLTRLDSLLDPASKPSPHEAPAGHLGRKAPRSGAVSGGI